MVSILNDSNIMKVKQKKITFSSTSYLRMKSENALKFIKSVMTLSIATGPTWRTEHRRYLAERLKVLAALEEESVLSALVTTHEMRHGTKVDVYSHPQWGYTSLGHQLDHWYALSLSQLPRQSTLGNEYLRVQIPEHNEEQRTQSLTSTRWTYPERLLRRKPSL